MYTYEVPSWTGLVYPTDCYFPTWVLPEDHVVTKSTEETYRSLFGREPRTDKWTFSTNGVSIMGRYGIPVVGFGPGKEKEAHAPDEDVETGSHRMRGPVRRPPSNLRRQIQLNTGNSLRASSPAFPFLFRSTP